MPEDREKLNINKSSLWYIKQNIEHNKINKMYKKAKQKVGN